MISENIDTEFEKAYHNIASFQNKIPLDDMLRLYAYYKQATGGIAHSFEENTDIVRSFKFNAWKQINHMSMKEAKIAYINLVKKILQ